jgi:hypothetical protein
MTTATLFQKREALRSFYSQGIKPVDGRQPIPEELAQEMVQELIDLNVPKDALIGVVDTFLTLSLTLLEHGFTNLVLLENSYKNLTDPQERYYNNIRGICEKLGIKYYIPPMNNYGRCDMKFDVVIGNPPYQSDNGGGSFRGSTTNPLWFQITKNSINLLKKGGILSFVTPTNIVNGGDHFTKLVLGAEREYDLVNVDFSADDYFKVGIPICRWILKKSLTNEHNVVVNDGRILDATTTLKISNDTIFDEIMNKILSYDEEKLNFNQSNSYDFRSVARYLKKQNLPVEWAKDLKLTQDEVYQYPVNINGKIKYSRIKWKNNGTWRLFIAKMQNPLTFEISKEWEADGSTFTMVFDSEEDALRTQSYLNDPIYKWIIEQTRVSGRVNGTTISKFPNTPIQKVLTSDQLSYIKSKL